MSYAVLHDYNAANSKELSVKRGELVDVIEAPPKKQWWKVRWLAAWSADVVRESAFCELHRARAAILITKISNGLVSSFDFKHMHWR